MTHSIFSFAALALLASLSAGDAAWPKSDKPSKTEIRRSVLEYAMCVVKSKHKQASDAILFTGDDGESVRDFAGSTPRCLPSDAITMGFGGDLYRYTLAEALIGAEFTTSGPGDFSDRPALKHPSPMTKAQFDASVAAAASSKRRAFLEDVYEKQKAVNFLSRYGECVAREDPQNTRNLILARPGSVEESKQIEVLRPVFSACLEPDTLGFSRATMRGTLALNYYRLAHASPSAGAAGLDAQRNGQ